MTEEELTKLARKVVRRRNIQVRLKRLRKVDVHEDGSVSYHGSFDGHTVTLDERLEGEDQLALLAHEIAHETASDLHGPDHQRETKRILKEIRREIRRGRKK